MMGTPTKSAELQRKCLKLNYDNDFCVVRSLKLQQRRAPPLLQSAVLHLIESADPRFDSAALSRRFLNYQPLTVALTRQSGILLLVDERV